MANGMSTMPVRASQKPVETPTEKGWAATVIDAILGKSADTAVQKVADSTKQQVVSEIESVKAKVDDKVTEVTSGDKSKYLILGAFLMSAVSLGLEVWNSHKGNRTSQVAPTTVNVYYDRPNDIGRK